MAVVIALAFAVLGYFAYSSFTAKSAKASTICSLVIDTTNSVENSAAVQNYKTLAGEVVKGCQSANAMLDVWTVNQSGPNTGHLGTYPLYSTAVNGPAIERELNGTYRSVMRAINGVFSDGPTGGTGGSNITAAIQLAALNLQREARTLGVKTKKLIVLTDGMQLTDNVSVRALSSLGDNPVLLVAAAKSEFATNLQGVQVFFYGVNTGQMASNGQELPPWFDLKVQNFWQKLVSADGGTNCAYQQTSSSEAILVCGGDS